MPEYTYKHPDREEYEDVYQSMSEEHVFSKDGVEWERVYTNPQINANGGKIDPFSNKEFVDKTGRMKGTMGDLFDLSAEMSHERAEKEGKDPVKEKFLTDYKKKTGKTHHSQVGKGKFENKFFEVTNE